MSFRLTPLAAEDLRQILRHSSEQFGEKQARRYGELIRKAIGKVADKPERANTRTRKELGDGIRSFAIAVVAERIGAARHILYFRKVSGGVEILRILHDAMDPSRRIE